MYKQVKFIDRFEDSPTPTHPIGGIGIFEDDKLVGVICGECGGQKIENEGFEFMADEEQYSASECWVGC